MIPIATCLPPIAAHPTAQARAGELARALGAGDHARMPPHRTLAALLLPLLVALAPCRAPAAERLQVSPWIDGGIAAGSVALWLGVTQSLAPDAPLHAPASSPPGGIDRWAPLSRDEGWSGASDAIMWTAVGASSVLTLADGWRDENVVAHAAIVTEALLVNGTLTNVIKQLARRARPYAYADPVGSPNDRHAFFSGHTSGTAAATFAAARVFDLTGDLDGWERAGLYGSAALLTAGVGVSRVQAGQHFPTDVLVGGLFGMAVGLGVPELHRPGGWLFGGAVGPAGDTQLAVSGSF